jgi:hypothetical protein
MCDSDSLQKLQKWMAKNRTGLMSNPGNRGNRVTQHLYNIIFNNNINIIDSVSPDANAVTPDHFPGVTGVTDEANPESESLSVQLPPLPEINSMGNQNNQVISARLPELPRLPPSPGKREVDPERTFLSDFLFWMDAEAGQWPGETLKVMLHIQEWFQGQGYQDPADLILAFVTVQELMRRKGGPAVIAPEAATLERLAREVFGPEVAVYWAPEGAEV